MANVNRNHLPLVLIILDGWGYAPAGGGNAIAEAKTQYFDYIWKYCPRTLLTASGVPVGLPEGSPGNSEAGHLNIGAGRVVHLDVTLIDQMIKDGSFFQNKVILEAVAHATKNNSNMHLMGLLSKAGTHSLIAHLYALLSMMRLQKFDRVFVHLFSDGRDSDPTSAIELVAEVEAAMQKIGVGRIVSISGRYFAMDRDNRWGRISRAYNLMVKGEGAVFPNAQAAIAASYSQGITDEFIEPRMIADQTNHFPKISNNDSIVFFNFRSDRTRELSKAFLDEKIAEFPDRVKLENLFFATFGIYDEQAVGHRVFYPEAINTPLAKAVSDAGLKQFHTAETEKYPHVTYFINGSRVLPFPGEERMVIPSSRKYKTYDLIPEMSANSVTNELLTAINHKIADFYIVNFANTDMVGHTGNFFATVAAAEFVDKCLGRILQMLKKLGGTAFVLADHGNAEQMVNPKTGEPDTEHTTNPVPFVIFSSPENLRGIRLATGQALSAVTPTALDFIGLSKPADMTASSLIVKDVSS